MQNLISVSDLLDASIDVYQKERSMILSISSIALLGTLLTILSLLFFPFGSKLLQVLLQNDTFNSQETLGIILVALATTISSLLHFWVITALNTFIAARLKNATMTLHTTLSTALKLLLPSLWILILISVFFILFCVSAYIPAVLVAKLFPNANLLNGITLIGGTLAIVVGSFRYALPISLAPYALFLKQKRGLQALLYTHSLTKGRLIKTLIRFFAPKILFTICGLIVGTLFSFIIHMALDPFVGLNMDLYLRTTTLIDIAVTGFVTLLIQPLLLLPDLLLCRNLIETSEGMYENRRSTY